MPFKSEKQRKWMHANEPEMAKKWEKEEESVDESTKSWNKSLEKIAKDKQLKSLSKKDRDTLMKIAKLMKKSNESVNEAIEPQGNIKKVLDVNKTKTAKKIGGTLVDITTANMMSQVWDKVNDKSKEKMNKMNTRQLTNLILKLWNALGTPRV